jgi:hypothetical protein
MTDRISGVCMALDRPEMWAVWLDLDVRIWYAASATQQF